MTSKSLLPLLCFDVDWSQLSDRRYLTLTLHSHLEMEGTCVQTLFVPYYNLFAFGLFVCLFTHILHIGLCILSVYAGFLIVG